MKIITYCVALAMWALALTNCHAQEERENNNIAILEKSKERFINDEKEALKLEVEAINGRLDREEITFGEAEELKKKVAERRALNIENKLAIVDNKIALLQRNGSDDKDIVLFGLGTNQATGESLFGISFKNTPEYKRKYDRRTSSDLVFSFGLNNAIIDGQSLSDSPYKIAGSRYAEIGLALKTRVFKESNWLRIKYGISFQFNGLKPTDNRYFVDTGSQTVLQEFPQDLNKSKFRTDNLVIPVHFEIGPSKKIQKDTYFRYQTEHSFKVGFGGYAGINLGVRQKLKFDSESETVRQKLKANYNTNNFVYGLSGYIGWGDVSLYGKYDLNTIFKDNPVGQHNISMGLRWDWD